MDEKDLKRARVAYTEWKKASEIYKEKKDFSEMDKWRRRHGDFLQDITQDICGRRPELRKISMWRVIQIIKEESNINT